MFKTKSDQVWAKKRAVIEALRQHPYFENDLFIQVTLWRNRENSTDIRVFLEGLNCSGEPWKICCYIGGNKSIPPQYVQGASPEMRPKILSFSMLLYQKWPNGIRTNSRVLNSYCESDIDDLNDYHIALGA